MYIWNFGALGGGVEYALLVAERTAAQSEEAGIDADCVFGGDMV